MDAFERDVARGLDRLAGPSLPVDAMAVAHTASLVKRKWTGPRSLRLLGFAAVVTIIAVVAGAVGLTLRSSRDGPNPRPASSPITTDELLAPMVTIEVTPGVFEIRDDGAGHHPSDDDLTGNRGQGEHDIFIGERGEVWVLFPQGGVEDRGWAWQVGRPHPDTPGANESKAEEVAVGPDGTLWVWTWDGLYSWDGDAWTDRTPGRWEPQGWMISGSFEGLALGSDGVVWFSRPAEPGSVMRLDDDGFHELGAETGIEGYVEQLVTTPSGDVWINATDGVHSYSGGVWEQRDPAPAEAGSDALLRIGTDGKPWIRYRGGLVTFDGEAWHAVETPEIPENREEPAWAVGTDGTVWLADLGWGLDSFDGEDWSPHLKDVAVDAIDVARDGTVWASAGSMMAAFDGTDWVRYPMPEPVTNFSLAPDGSVWAESSDRLFVIPSRREP